MVGFVRIETRAQLEIDVRHSVGQTHAIVSDVDGRGFQYSEICDHLAELMSVENVQQAILATTQNEIVIGRQNRGCGAEILIAVIVIIIGLALRVSKRNEPVIES